MEPMFGGGEMIHEVFHDRSTYKPVPYKFEAGTMQIAQQVGLGAAVDYLEALGMDAVRAHEEEITRVRARAPARRGGHRLRTEGRRCIAAGPSASGSRRCTRTTSRRS